MAKCLRCGAGNEWISGHVAPASVSRYEGADKKRLTGLKIGVGKIRNFPEGTCAASRHLHIMANRLTSKAGSYIMLQEEPDHCAESMLAVLYSLWQARAEIVKLKAKLARDHIIVGERDVG